MDLVRLSVSKETLLPITVLDALPESVTVRFPETTIRQALPQRNATDTLRVALAHKAQAWQKFQRLTNDGELQECKAIIDSPTETGQGLDYRIRVRRRDTRRVSYSEEIATIRGGNGQPLVAEVTETGRVLYPDLVADLCDIQALQSFGEQHYFDNDIRRLAQDLLKTHTLRLWPGTFLALSLEASLTIAALQALCSLVSQGSATCRLLSLDDTPANREALARELAEKWNQEAEELLAALGFTDPNLKRIRKAYDALVERVKQTEDLLDTEVPCWDALAEIELQLDALDATTTKV